MTCAFICSPTNSTLLTRRCGTPILDYHVNYQSCGQKIYPGADATVHQRRVSRWNIATEEAK